MATHGVEAAQSLRGADDDHIEAAERREEEIALRGQLTAVSEILPMSREHDLALAVVDGTFAVQRRRQRAGAERSLRVEVDAVERGFKQRGSEGHEPGRVGRDDPDARA